MRRKGAAPLTRTFTRYDEAVRWILQVEGRIVAPDFIDQAEARRTTLAEALQRYLDEITPDKKGAKQERNRILAWLRDPLADRSLGAIRSVDIAEWRTARVQAGKAPTTIKNALTIISQVYGTVASDWGMEGLKDPVRGVRMPKSRPARDRRLEPGEKERLLAAIAAPATHGSDL